MRTGRWPRCCSAARAHGHAPGGQDGVRHVAPSALAGLAQLRPAEDAVSAVC